MQTQLNVRINQDLKRAVKRKSDEEGVPIEVLVTNLLADLVGEDRFKINFDRGECVIHPPKDPAPGWCPEIDGISFSSIDDWLEQHDYPDTSVKEVWHNCFHGLRRGPSMKEITMIGFYIQRRGWGKTARPTSAYRVNRLHGRSAVFIRVENTASSTMSDLLV